MHTTLIFVFTLTFVCYAVIAVDSDDQSLYTNDNFWDFVASVRTKRDRRPQSSRLHQQVNRVAKCKECTCSCLGVCNCHCTRYGCKCRSLQKFGYGSCIAVTKRVMPSGYIRRSMCRAYFSGFTCKCYNKLRASCFNPRI